MKPILRFIAPIEKLQSLNSAITTWLWATIEYYQELSRDFLTGLHFVARRWPAGVDAPSRHDMVRNWAVSSAVRIGNQRVGG
jgi:hypothetical protein